VIAKIIVNREAADALRSGDPQRIAEAISIIDAYRRTGTEQARAFRQRRDPVESPAQRRRRLLTEALLTPPRGVTTDLWARRLANVGAELKKMGIGPDTIEEASKDDRAAARLLRLISAQKATKWDALHEYWLAAILSAPPTHVVNMASNFAHIGWH